MRRAISLGLMLAAAGCSSARYGASDTGAPSITLPAHFAEGSTGKSADAGSPVAAPAARSGDAATPPSSTGEHHADPPDPDPPLRTADLWEYSLEYKKGSLRVAGVRRVKLDRAVVMPRRLGRFAFELWIGAELVERVRFDFPLLAADLPPEGTKRPLRDVPRFGPSAETSQEVQVPASDRATSAVVVDRLTGTRVPVPWPPDEPAAPGLPPPRSLTPPPQPPSQPP